MYSLLRTLPRVLSRTRPSTSPVFSAAKQTFALRAFSVSQRVAFPTAAGASTGAKSAGKKVAKAAGEAGATKKKTTAVKKKATATAAGAKKTAAKPKRKNAASKKKVAAKDKKVTLKREMYPPKQPIAGFFLFAEKYRNGKPKCTTIQDGAAIAKEAGAVWRSMTLAEKAPFEAESREAAEKYKEALAEWWKTADKKVIREINRRRLKTNRRRLVRRVPADQRRPATGYNRFVASELKNETFNGRDQIQDRMREVAKKWKSLSAEDKSVFDGPAKAELDAFNAKKAAEAKASA